MLSDSDLIRPISHHDARACLGIYQFYVENSVVSFEEIVPTIEQMTERIESTSQSYPWLVYEVNGCVAGYAYGSSFRPRPAYRWAAEVTIYLAAQFKGKGIAAELYQSLFDALIKLGFYNAIAVVTEPNPESEKFHQKMGFKKIGKFESVGFKLNQWNDIGWWQKQLQPVAKNPLTPKAFRP